MRTKKEHKPISVEKSVYERLEKDKNHFQKIINGGVWSFNDTIKEYHKILDDIK